MGNKRFTPKEALMWVPSLEEMIGNVELKEHLQDRLNLEHPRDETHLLIQGQPGTGKTAVAISYLRQRLNDQTLGYEESNTGLFAMAKDTRYYVVRVNGARSEEKWMREQFAGAVNEPGEHTFILVDEIGELYYRGLEQMLRDVMERNDITVIATAQDFHRKKRKGDTDEDDERRLKAFHRRFSTVSRTQCPTDEGIMVGYIIKLCELWGIERDNDETVKLLAKKVLTEEGYNVGYAVRYLITELYRPKPYMTRDRVMRFIADPGME